VADNPQTERRAPRNRLTRWAAMAAAAGRYREGRIPIEQAAKEAGVTLDEFQQFLLDSPART
jgi:predicted HTH domain antitoxin